MNYIDLFKNRIGREVVKNSGNKLFVDSLFPIISADIIKAGNLTGLPEVDNITLMNYFLTAKNEFLSVNPIDPGISHSLTKKGFKTWLNEDRENDIIWDYSNRYFQYLSKSGRSSKVIEEISRSSLSIFKKLADPKSSNAVFSKGLVVGAVQSGKTGNFNGVINRAIDSGYVLIIVLSGIMEDLRSQTQRRIETDIIGEGSGDSSSTTGKKGVGEIRRFGQMGDSSVIQVKSITSEQKDFGRTTQELDFTLNDKYVLVCKKNVGVLRNLIVWLHNSLENNQDKHHIPFLIIDDEADNASLNNLGAKGREYASKTNIQIRSLLALFSIKSYLGYTATPFANVLQDRNDIPNNKYIEKFKYRGELLEKELEVEGNIFPDDFIELLEPPSNYVGAKQIFETISPIENNTDENEKIPLVAPPVRDYMDEFPSRVYIGLNEELVSCENIPTKKEWEERFGYEGYLNWQNYGDYRRDTRAPKKDDDFPKKLPNSLKDAIKCFILALAIREHRIPLMEKSDLYQPHNSMLIHVSRFTIWQNTTKNLVEDYVHELVSKINNENPNSSDSIYYELEKTWYRYYAHIVEKIKQYLPVGYEDEFMIPVVYESIKKILPEAIRNIEVKGINSSTKEKLEYPKNNPKKIIAIGGNTLSRGFTLEGLTINYFVRTTNYSDALLQMGRWFGYRPGYLDCCKIFTTQDSLDKFNSTTKCIEELETEFKKMEEKGKDPNSFVLRVKKHPGALQITRPSILKNAVEVRWSYQDQLEMTTRFNVNKLNIEKVWKNFVTNIAPKFNERNDTLLTYQTSGNEIIEILQQPNNFNDGTGKINQMVMFIKLCNEKGLLNEWTVAVKTSGNATETMKAEEINLNPKLIQEVSFARRSGPNINSDDKLSFINDKIFKASGKNANIISSNTDMGVSLSTTQKELAARNFYFNKANELKAKNKRLTDEEALNKAQTYKTIPERYYRELMTEDQAVLIIYLFDSTYAFNQSEKNQKENPELFKEFEKIVSKEGINLKIPLVGYALGFPPMESDVGGIYMKGDYELETDEGEEELVEEIPEEILI